jgi:hypothetical protein
MTNGGDHGSMPKQTKAAESAKNSKAAGKSAAAPPKEKKR